MSLEHLCARNITWNGQTRKDNYLKRLFHNTDIAATYMELLTLHQGTSCSNRTTGAIPCAEVFSSRLGIRFIHKQCFSFVNSLQKYPE